MELAEVRRILATHEAELSALGVGALAVFGSVARGEADAESDVDLLLTTNREIDLVEYHDICFRLEDVLGCEVDLVMPSALKPRVRRQVLAEAVNAT